MASVSGKGLLKVDERQKTAARGGLTAGLGGCVLIVGSCVTFTHVVAVAGSPTDTLVRVTCTALIHLQHCNMAVNQALELNMLLSKNLWPSTINIGPHFIESHYCGARKCRKAA